MKTSDMLNVEINKLNYIRSYTYLYFFLKMETPTIFGIHSFILKPGFTCAFNITRPFIGFYESSIIQYSVFELPSFCVSYSITSFFLSFSTQVLLISFLNVLPCMLIHKKEAPYRLLSGCFRTIDCQKKIIQRCDCLYTFFFTICTKDRCTKRAIKGTIKYKRQINTCTFEFVLGLIPKTLFRSFSEF